MLLSHRAQVGTSDGEVDIVKRLDRLELNNDQFGDEQVWPVEPDLSSAVQDRDRELALNGMNRARNSRARAFS